jgi:hypothetical protein
MSSTRICSPATAGPASASLPTGSRSRHRGPRFPTAGNREIDPFDPFCGNVHFPPNGVHDYDYQNTQSVSATCIGFGRHQGPGNTDTKDLIGTSQWLPRFSTWDGCGGELMVWWYQNMPGYGSGQTFSDGRPMKSMWPFWYY